MTKPNILFIICHDLGQELNCYGNESVTSPHLDKIAAEGVRFVNHFCTSTPCSPSRGCIMTGRYAHSNGLMGLVNLGWDLPRQPGIARYMNQLGYATYLFGLQHEAKDRNTLGYKYVKCQESRRAHIVAQEVAKFLRAEATRTQPFFLCAGFTEVHLGFQKPEYIRADPATVKVHPYLHDTPEVRDELAWFHGAIKFMDEHIGRLLDALKKSGLEKDTLVVFTTDHGAAFPRAKSTLYDPGIRTTLLMRWPKGLPKGKAYTQLLNNIDLLPTLIELAGGKPDTQIQGRSFLPLLRRKPYAERPEIFSEKNYHDTYDPMRCIRTSQFKYIRNFRDGCLPIPADIARSQASSSLGEADFAPRPGEELYDLVKDPVEKNNVVDDPAYQTIKAELSSKLDKWMEKTNDPLLKEPIIRAPDGAYIAPLPKTDQEALAYLTQAKKTS